MRALCRSTVRHRDSRGCVWRTSIDHDTQGSSQQAEALLHLRGHSYERRREELRQRGGQHTRRCPPSSHSAAERLWPRRRHPASDRRESARLAFNRRTCDTARKGPLHACGRLCFVMAIPAVDDFSNIGLGPTAQRSDGLLQRSPEVGERILHPRRHLGEDLALEEAIGDK